MFDAHNYGNLFDLLAIFKSGDPALLGASDEVQDARATIFEEFAKGGLERMEQESRGSIDLTDYILSLVARYRTDKEPIESGSASGLDLSELLDD